MADENRELLEAMEELRRAMGATTVDFEELEEQLKKSQTGMKAFSKALKSAPGDITKGLGSFAKGVADGDTSLKSFNTIVDTATGVLSSLAATVPLVGGALSGSIKAVGEASKFVVNQLEATAKTFNDFGQVGALTSKGMSGLAEQFNRSGLSMQGFQKAVTENASALARFRGTVGEGAEEFSKVVGGIVDSGAGTELRRLGFSADQIGDTAGAFVAQQTRLGRAQAMTTRELTEGSVRYARELDLLSKVTGMNREAIQKQQDAALSETRFRSTTEKMIAQGRVQEATTLRNLQTVFDRFDGEVGQGIRDLASGFVTSDAALKVFNSTGGKAAEILARVKDGQLSFQDAQLELQKAFSENKTQIYDLGEAVGDSINVYNKSAAVADIVNSEMIKGQLMAKKTQEEQTAGQDDLTNKTVDAQRNLEKMNRQFYRLGFELMPQAATAIEKFTGVMNQALDSIGSKLGIKMPGSKGAGGATVGGGATGGGAPSTAEMLTGGATAQLTAAEISASGGQTPTYDPYQYIAFTGGTGTREHFDKLQGDVKEAFLFLARDYNQLTGKKLQINSAFRSPEEQANVDSGGNPKAAPGMSLHNIGRALDLNSSDVDFLASNGLLGKYGFNRLPGDPPHIYAKNGFSGMLSGPTSGYRPNLTMHGTEQISITPAGSSAVSGPTSDNGLLQAQLTKLEELVSVMKTQVGISTKLLQYSS